MPMSSGLPEIKNGRHAENAEELLFFTMESTEENPTGSHLHRDTALGLVSTNSEKQKSLTLPEKARNS